MRIGTEHEYSINDRLFRPQPCNDRIIEKLSGRLQNEFSFHGIGISKELQKHVLEVKTEEPKEQLAEIEALVHGGLRRLRHALGNEYRFLGLGMHPTLRLHETTYWDHEEGDVYREYDRLFDIRQHGWLNIQALQINIPFENDGGLVRTYNRVRALLPYLIAVSAASPFVEGAPTDYADNRLVYYKKNQRKMPIITYEVIPERLKSVQDYLALQRAMYRELEREGASVLCNEWVDSRGVIVRFSRNCIEIKALDEQECVRSDMAVTAFLLALVRSRELDLEEDRDALLALTECAIRRGTEGLRSELEQLYKAARGAATKDEDRYLALVGRRIADGSLSERIRNGKADMPHLLCLLERSLMENVSYEALAATP
ncbi:MAG: glutamate-cysteine ligase family protein [Candidatus Thermoplasmatota archaeon]